MSRPSDHIDSPDPSVAISGPGGDDIVQPKLGLVGWLRWFWRQLTSMRTALFLLLLLAFAAVPGSLVPQRAADPNGVTQYFADNPSLAPFLDKLQAFDVYTSVWFSSIYLLLFISLVGCVIPRAKHHFDALRAKPPRTPRNLARLGGFQKRELAAESGTSAVQAIEVARRQLRKSGYRVVVFADAGADGSTDTASVSAERGYARETGNLVFHAALVGILMTVGVGGGFGFAGQRTLVEGGGTFVNTLSAFDTFNPGRFFSENSLDPYSLKLDQFTATYETKADGAFGQPIDYNATVTTQEKGQPAQQSTIKVNSPLRIGGTDVYLLGNGYAPTITVKDPAGNVVFTDSVPFLPQDANLTSVGVVKIPDGLARQLGMIGFFYPTQATSTTGAFYSSYPDAQYPVLTLNVYDGDLGLNGGVPTSVYSLNTDKMTQLTGGKTGVKSIELKPGDSQSLPDGLGTISFDAVHRYASLDIHHDPTQGWVLLFAASALGGLLISLFIPRRRVWVKATERSDGTLTLEYAGLARGEDPRLVSAVTEIADRHTKTLSDAPDAPIPADRTNT
ncbi:cytochrome c biogenesis protein ResB [Subtercola sp. PAMC28395]|uniref:cytochrome c biogenesis protein ResB n=1 Tax=Subtercola sp. PAMC28395 TaxID=2846775 RepID=UPI001C0CAF70|nr:cytochrome c biogenesis protein ResB [Subtercola sp. PAMC28395]QWT24336.1 cytochrome c biogenesis protein ResB [Subtercola sp. PAMC28395]